MSLDLNNPGRLIICDDRWQGLHEDQTDHRFFRFVDPQHGIAAAVVVLRQFHRVREFLSVGALMSAWAPSIMEVQEQYQNYLSDRLGVHPAQPLVLNRGTMANLVEGIIRFENWGHEYSLPTLAEGLRLAGYPSSDWRLSLTERCPSVDWDDESKEEFVTNIPLRRAAR